MWNGQVIADSQECEVVENNYYFPPDDVDKKFLDSSDHQSTCPWKGEASYYDVVVDGQRNENAAWYYPKPKDAARQIAGYVAFWKGVEIKD